jgi:hypothetical protein
MVNKPLHVSVGQRPYPKPPNEAAEANAGDGNTIS